MLEKLKSAVQNSASSKQSKPVESHVTNDIQKLYPTEECPVVQVQIGSLPKRDSQGLTLTQEIGVFPRHVALQIRHNHPTLGLKEVAHQRQCHSEKAPNFEMCFLQQVNQNQPRGVLTLGLPPNMTRRPKSAMAKKCTSTGTSNQYPVPLQSASSEAIHHYYETLSPKYANIVRDRVCHDF
jgi:hypothetical protein